MLRFAIGDIHGQSQHLAQMLDKISLYAGNQDHEIITLGDYIDRGPDSKGVLDILMSRPDVIPLLGNHEQMLLEAINGTFQDRLIFLKNGGDKTLDSFNVDYVNAIGFEYIEFLMNLRYSYEDARRFYVHAGIDPTMPLSHQLEHTMLWIRQKFLACNFPFEKYVVHGHTPVFEAEILNNRANLDTGCCFQGILSCAVFDDAQDKPIDLITVQI